jgi:hypothetical protein
MDDDRPKPDHAEDPRGADVGQGYPETNPKGSNPGPPTPEDDDGTRAPSTSGGGRDSGPEVATGNPHAAG